MELASSFGVMERRAATMASSRAVEGARCAGEGTYDVDRDHLSAEGANLPVDNKLRRLGGVVRLRHQLPRPSVPNDSSSGSISLSPS